MTNYSVMDGGMEYRRVYGGQAVEDDKCDGWVECIDSMYPRHVWLTYFVSDGFALKIGKAKSVIDRIARLQTGNPNKLRAIAVIGGDHEKALHRRFRHNSVSGEWFRFDSGLLDWIREHAHINPDAYQECLEGQKTGEADSRFPAVRPRIGKVGEEAPREDLLFRTLGQPRPSSARISGISIRTNY
jgi:hypothetical protein